MKLDERIVWDTTEYPVEYPEKIRKIYFKMNLSNRKPFTKWIGSLSKNFQNDIDWWINLPLTRDPYTSQLFHIVCLLKTLEHLKKKFKNILIKVNSRPLFNIIKNWSEDNNLTINIEFIKKNKKTDGYLTILKAIIFHIFVFFFLKFFSKKIVIKKNTNKNVLIDTFATKFFCLRKNESLL